MLLLFGGLLPQISSSLLCATHFFQVSYLQKQLIFTLFPKYVFRIFQNHQKNFNFRLMTEAVLSRYSAKTGFLKYFCNVYRKTLILKSLFVSPMLEVCFTKKRIQHWCFPVNFSKFLKSSILKNTYYCVFFSNKLD